jgi:hypothetical protein
MVHLHAGVFFNTGIGSCYRHHLNNQFDTPYMIDLSKAKRFRVLSGGRLSPKRRDEAIDNSLADQ